MAMKLHQFYTRTIPRPEPLNANGKEPGAEVGQSWGRWYAHGHASRHADMPRHAVGKKRYQMMPNDTKKNCIELHQIALRKSFALSLYLILPTISFMCCVARGLL